MPQGVEAAHVVGASMAGLLLTLLGVRHRRRVASLTFISTMSPDPDAGMGEDYFAALEGNDRVEDLVRPWATPVRSTAGGQPSTWLVPTCALCIALPPSSDPRKRLPARLADGRGSLHHRRALPGRPRRPRSRLAPRHAKAFAPGIPRAMASVIEGMGHLPRPAD